VVRYDDEVRRAPLGGSVCRLLDGRHGLLRWLPLAAHVRGWHRGQRGGSLSSEANHAYCRFRAQPVRPAAESFPNRPFLFACVRDFRHHGGVPGVTALDTVRFVEDSERPDDVSVTPRYSRLGRERVRRRIRWSRRQRVSTGCAPYGPDTSGHIPLDACSGRCRGLLRGAGT